MTPTRRPSAARLALLAPTVLLLPALLSGCLGDEAGDDRTYAELGFTGSDPTGRDPAAWPDLEGTTLTILDHGAFGAFDSAAAAFEALTGAKVVHVEADDTGSALNRAILEKGDPSADVIYGLDNVLLSRAEDAGILEPYRPLLAGRVQQPYLFFDADGAWPATPVDHGYIAVNWDPAHPALANRTLASLEDVRAHADLFVTQDPNTSSVGLGFLLATIRTYGEGWQDYWTDLFEGGVLVTAGWSEAYEQHFSAGYGADPSFGGQADKPIVASYTESPAYEVFFGRPEDQAARVVTAPHSTFHQVQTMAVLDGAPNRAAAQAWIEFSLTDAFQELAAPENGVYPVVATVDADATYGDVDPEPGTFEPARFAYRDLGRRLEGWLAAWTALCEQHECR